MNIFFGLFIFSAMAFDPAGFDKSTFADKNKAFSFQCDHKTQSEGFDMQMPPFFASVKYTGKIQTIHKKRKTFISSMAKSLSQNFDQIYEREIAVEENGKTYWLPAQNSFLESFLPTAKKDMKMDAYVRHIGCTTIDKANEHIYLLISSPK